MSTDSTTASCFLLMSRDDNCLIVRMTLPAGMHVEIDGASVTLTETIPLGHKVARRALELGERVLRYGAPIGTTTAPVAAGGHIHTHNLKSDYIPTYTLTSDGHHFIEKEQSS